MRSTSFAGNFGSTACLVAPLLLAGACADPCVDDGLGQKQCPEAETEGFDDSMSDDSASGEESSNGSGSMDAGSGSASMSGSGSAGTDDGSSSDSTSDSSTSGSTTSGSTTDDDTSGSASATNSSSASASETDSASASDGTASDGSGGGNWCVDADGDGFGDSTMCTTGDDPGDGWVGNGDDCDDTNDHTHPGAAENEPDGTCTKDNDDDGWGDSDPPDGVDPGADCDDEDDTSAVNCQPCTPDDKTCMGDDLYVCNDDGDWDVDEVCTYGCNDVDDVCNDALTVDAGNDVNITLGESADLLAVAMGGDGNYSWMWTPAATLSDLAAADPSATPSESTTYRVDVQDGAANTAADHVTVHVTDAPVDFTKCTPYEFPIAQGPDDPNWQFSNAGATACQAGNTRPAALICDVVLENARLSGTFTINDPDDDDDDVGFMWGVQDTERFYLFTWKRSNQNFAGCGFLPRGMTIKRIDAQSGLQCEDMFDDDTTTNSELLVAPDDFYGLGWAENTTYEFELVHLSDQFTVTIRTAMDDAVVATTTVMDSAYPSGRFGVLDFSQLGICFDTFMTAAE